MDQSLEQFALRVISAEAQAAGAMQKAVNDAFERACKMILDCPASLLLTGMGKAGHVARKLSATFSSTGTPSHFLSPADAVHGDMGCVRKGDLVMILSGSGESDEVTRLVNLVGKLGYPIIAMTGSRASSLGKAADVVLEMGKIQEACPLGLAPSASTTAMLVLGDALALSVMHLRHFQAEDFALYHPAGQLGRRLMKVCEAMGFRLGENLPVASDQLTVAQVLQQASTIKRRSGAVILTDSQGKISGMFTDADLRRLLTGDSGAALARPIAQVMTRNPRRIGQDRPASEALGICRKYRYDELPVVDQEDRPVGLIDVQDLVVLKVLDVDEK